MKKSEGYSALKTAFGLFYSLMQTAKPVLLKFFSSLVLHRLPNAVGKLYYYFYFGKIYEPGRIFMLKGTMVVG